MTAHSAHGVIPAKAGTHGHLGSKVLSGLRSWFPASAGMTPMGRTRK